MRTWVCNIIIGIKIHHWALVEIYSRDVGVCCQIWGCQGRSFARNTKIMFSNGCWTSNWSRLRVVSQDLAPAQCREPGPLRSHRHNFSLNIACFSSQGIFIAMRYNICPMPIAHQVWNVGSFDRENTEGGLRMISSLLCFYRMNSRGFDKKPDKTGFLFILSVAHTCV